MRIQTLFTPMYVVRAGNSYIRKDGSLTPVRADAFQTTDLDAQIVRAELSEKLYDRPMIVARVS